MKFKALRTKKEPKEFVEIQRIGDLDIPFTGEMPRLLAESATMELLKEYYAKECPALSMDYYELIELEVFEANTVGADIRNKLSPSLNLISLLRIYFQETENKEDDAKMREKLLPFIKKEMAKSEETIKYISNLL